MIKKMVSSGKKHLERDILEPIFDPDEELHRHQQQTRLGAAKATLHAVTRPPPLDSSDDEMTVDAHEVDRSLIAERLQRAASVSRGLRPFHALADGLRDVAFGLTATLRSNHAGHPITRLVLAHPALLFSADKAGLIVKWRQWRGTWRKQHVFQPASSSVLSLAVSGNGKLLASGLADGSIFIHDAVSNRTLGQLQPNNHRGPVNSLVFNEDGTQLLSAGADRTVRVWAVDQLAYIDSLFGHQDSVMAISVQCNSSDRFMSVGGRDRSVRLWKTAEDSQLVFRLPEADGGSLDEVVSVGEHGLFVTGADSGVLSLWSTLRRRPISSTRAHAGPITAVYSPDPSDLIISGSNDGFIRFFKLCHTDADRTQSHLQQVNELPVPGHITGFAWHDQQLFVAVGPEGRFGRWTVDPWIKPSILVFSMSN